MKKKTQLLLTSAIAGAAFAAGMIPLAASAQTVAPPAAPAEGQVSEILVTATRMGATALQKTPLAVSVLSGSDLDRSITTDVKDLVQQTPNMNVSQNTASAQIYIRGIGTNNVLNGSDPDVTVQADGVYLARAFQQFTDFFDVERLEVLRGPQGTLYGRNAVGGVINIISRAPSDNPSGKAQITVGNYNAFQGQGYVNGPIIEGVLNASLAVSYVRHDGYIKNLVRSGEDDFSANHGGARLQLRWRPNSAIDATTRIDYSQADENSQSSVHLRVPAVLPYIANSIPIPAGFSSPLANSVIGDLKKTAHNQPTTLRKIDKGIAEDINITLNDHLSLRSLTAYRQAAYTAASDTDATEVASQVVVQADRSRQFSQEFNLTGQYDRFNFVAGLYYFHERQPSYVISAAQPGTFRAPAGSVYVFFQPLSRPTSKAVFAQVSYAITPQLKLTVGGRYTEDEKYFKANSSRFSYAAAPVIGAMAAGLPFIYETSPKFDAFTPKVGLEWQANDDVFAYASYTEGFKSGGNNYSPVCTSTSTPAVLATCIAAISYRPEKIKSYEGGLKTFWMNRRIIANATAFYYDYTNLQVQSILAPGVINTGNAATATVKGFELETQARLTDRFNVTATWSYLDATYDDFSRASVPNALIPFVNRSANFTAATNSFNATGNSLSNAPKYSANVSAQYTQPIQSGSVYGRVEYSYQSRVYFDPSNNQIMSQGAFGQANLSAGYISEDGDWTGAVVVRNAFDKEYYTSIFAAGAVPAGLSGAPRTIQLRIARNF